MKALLLILGLTFSITTFATDPPATPEGSRLGQTEGCSSGQTMQNCECIVDTNGTDFSGTEGSTVPDPTQPAEGAIR
jgi:hypothetical protein